MRRKSPKRISIAASKKKASTTSVVFQVTARKGPAATTDTLKLPYFVAVVSNDEKKLVSKRLFEIDVPMKGQSAIILSQEVPDDATIVPKPEHVLAGRHLAGRRQHSRPAASRNIVGDSLYVGQSGSSDSSKKPQRRPGAILPGRPGFRALSGPSGLPARQGPAHFQSRHAILLKAGLLNATARARQHLRIAEGLIAAGRRADAGGQARIAANAAAEAWRWIPRMRIACIWARWRCWHLGRMADAARLAARRAAIRRTGRSIVIPVLERPRETRFSIDGLLEDLAGFAGEVIVVFNDQDVFAALKDHPRIDKWAALSANAGVARAWNIGINLAEGAVVFVLNADLRLGSCRAVCLGSGVSIRSARAAAILGTSKVRRSIPRHFARRLPSTISALRRAARVDKISGYCFAIHADRIGTMPASLSIRGLSPYFYEELDAMLKAREAGLGVYTVPVDPANHLRPW